MNTKAVVAFESIKDAYAFLEAKAFPAISEYIRLFKTPATKQDEYILIRPLWDEDGATFLPQTYRIDRDINDMLLSKGFPTSVSYPALTDQGRHTIKKDSILAAWRRQAATQRGRLNGLCYQPGGEPIVGNLLNTFKDVSVPWIEPEGDPVEAVRDILDHLHNNICNGNTAYFSYFVGWLAHMVQKPTERPETGIAIIGDQGTGKGILITFLKRMLGGSQNVNTTASPNDTKSFNFALGNKLLVVFDEATFSGDRQQSDFMKKLVTEQKIRIEQKGLDAYEVDNFARVLITSNNMTSAVPADIGGRRWLILECKGPLEQKDMSALAIKIGNAGEDAEGAVPNYVNWFKFFLSTMDISKFEPRQLPVQNTGFETKLQGTYKESPVKAFLWDWLMAENLTLYRTFTERDAEQGTIERDVALKWERKVLLADVRAILTELTLDHFGTPPSKIKIAERLREFGLIVTIGAGGKRWVEMPHPTETYKLLRTTSRFDDPLTDDQKRYIERHWRGVTTDEGGTLTIDFESPEAKAAYNAKMEQQRLTREREKAEELERYSQSYLKKMEDMSEGVPAGHVSDGVLDKLFGIEASGSE